MDGFARLQWKKSTRSGGNAACVEVADLPGDGRAVRDSKDPHGAVLVVSAAQWAAFTISVRDGNLS
ncbi:MAG: DUF397 domain-containing protein [Actinomycetota bacterium]|nr:DUF397 domain-containing protein [Actinomycetota bacterium]